MAFGRHDFTCLRALVVGRALPSAAATEEPAAILHLLPVRDFIDTPAALMSLGLSSSNKRCRGPIWVLPSSGDHRTALLGEPIVDYRVPHVFVTNNLTGWPQWSPNGTMHNLGPGRAHQPGTTRCSATPVPASSTRRGGGTVTVDYGLGSGVLSGGWSETYSHYSDNGQDFVNGTVTIDETGPGVGTYTSNLTMTGVHTGSDHVTFNSATGVVHGQSTYDGHTVSGPSAEQAAKGACPSIQPKEPKLHVTATRARIGVYRIKVTSSIAGAGANEAGVETSPVYHATVTLGGVTTYTNRAGIAFIKVRHNCKLTVTAGDTLKPTSLSLIAR